MAALPAVLPLEGDVFLCHATPYNDVDCYLEDLVERELRPAPLQQIEERTQGCGASLIFCGHSHIPRLVHLSTGQLIVNPGSVGIQAYEGNDPARIGSRWERRTRAMRWPSAAGTAGRSISSPLPMTGTRPRGSPRSAAGRTGCGRCRTGFVTH